MVYHGTAKEDDWPLKLFQMSVLAPTNTELNKLRLQSLSCFIFDMSFTNAHERINEILKYN